MSADHRPEHTAAHDLGPYVLGALDAEEMRLVEEHLSGCEECRDELAQLTLVEASLGEVPAEFFLDGPAPDGDLMVQRAIRQVRDERHASGTRRRVVLGAAAAAVVGAMFGGGVLTGRESADVVVAPPVDAPTPPPSTGEPVPGTKRAEYADPATGAAMGVRVIPAAGWVKLDATVTGIAAGERCRVIVVGADGQEEVAGSWLVSEKGEAEGTALSGFAIVPPEDVTAVRVENLDGEEFVSVAVS